MEVGSNKLWGFWACLLLVPVGRRCNSGNPESYLFCPPDSRLLLSFFAGHAQPSTRETWLRKQKLIQAQRHKMKITHCTCFPNFPNSRSIKLAIRKHSSDYLQTSNQSSISLIHKSNNVHAMVWTDLIDIGCRIRIGFDIGHENHIRVILTIQN